MRDPFRYVLAELVRTNNDCLDVNRVGWFPSESEACAAERLWKSRRHNVWVSDSRNEAGHFIPLHVIERAWGVRSWDW